MKIATTLFLLPMLILGSFGCFGYLFKENQDLHAQVGQCVQIQGDNARLGEENGSLTGRLHTAEEKVAELQAQVDQFTSLLVEKEKGLIQAQKDVQDRDIKQAQTEGELQALNAQLAQARTELEQAKALLAELSAQTPDPVVGKQEPARSAVIPVEGKQLAGMAGAVIIVLVTFMGFRKLSLKGQAPRSNQPLSQTRRGQVTMTMTDQTYREFQSYLKNHK